MMPLPDPASALEPSGLTLFCWNINGLAPTLPNIKLKYGSFKAFLDHELTADVCCLQEVKMPEAKMTVEMACVEGFESFWATSQLKTGYSGVTTWVRTPAWAPVSAAVDDVGTSTGTGTDLDGEGRLVILDLGPFVLANVYVPNAGDAPARPRLDFKCRFLDALRVRMSQYKQAGREVLIVGDFNVAPEPRDVHTTFSHDKMYAAQELGLLRTLMKEFPDVWRLRHPDTTDQYTVWEERTNARAFNAGSRIDFVLASPGLLPRITSCEILHDMPRKWSDHAPLLLKLSGLDRAPGPRPPCPGSSRLMKRFAPGPNIKAFFAPGGPRPSKRHKPEPVGQGPAVAVQGNCDDGVAGSQVVDPLESTAAQDREPEDLNQLPAAQEAEGGAVTTSVEDASMDACNPKRSAASRNNRSSFSTPGGGGTSAGHQRSIMGFLKRGAA